MVVGAFFQYCVPRHVVERPSPVEHLRGEDLGPHQVGVALLLPVGVDEHAAHHDEGEAQDPAEEAHTRPRHVALDVTEVPQDPAECRHRHPPDGPQEPGGYEPEQGAERVEGGQVDEEEGQYSELQRSLVALEGGGIRPLADAAGDQVAGPGDGVPEVGRRAVLHQGLIHALHPPHYRLSAQILVQKQEVRQYVRYAANIYSR